MRGTPCPGLVVAPLGKADLRKDPACRPTGMAQNGCAQGVHTAYTTRTHPVHRFYAIAGQAISPAFDPANGARHRVDKSDKVGSRYGTVSSGDDSIAGFDLPSFAGRQLAGTVARNPIMAEAMIVLNVGTRW